MRRRQRRRVVAGSGLSVVTAWLAIAGCSVPGFEKEDERPLQAPEVPVSSPSITSFPATAPVEGPWAAPAPPVVQSAPAIATQPAQPPPPDPLDTACQEGMLAWEQGDLVRARYHLNRVLREGYPSERQRRVREILNLIADRTIFSPEILPGDPLVVSYRIVKGDTLSRIARKHGLTEELISSINRLSAGSVLRPGHQIKLVRGPFSATVVKSDHEMHLYLQDVYVRTCGVALGTDNKTPTGKWVVTTRLRHPSWVDPRNGRRYGSHDPDNPLGGYWIALKGIEGNAVGRRGYGIHGTNDEASIGTDASLGCVRLGKQDIEAVYAMLARDCIVTIIESGERRGQIE